MATALVASREHAQGLDVLDEAQYRSPAKSSTIELKTQIRGFRGLIQCYQVCIMRLKSTECAWSMVGYRLASDDNVDAADHVRMEGASVAVDCWHTSVSVIEIWDTAILNVCLIECSISQKTHHMPKPSPVTVNAKRMRTLTVLAANQFSFTILNTHNSTSCQRSVARVSALSIRA